MAALVYLKGLDGPGVREKLRDPTTRRIVSYNLAALTQFDLPDKGGLAAFLAGTGRLVAASTYLFWTNLGRAYFAAGQKDAALDAFRIRNAPSREWFDVPVEKPCAAVSRLLFDGPNQHPVI